ncbi:carbon-nitrogen hydrolase family protein [Aspergillus undulatus]|uniref:carbon-nitrogen hydrolase family protein n=1 Tax=Aspergillus undulatus TaxID=1810928 RepID=UPI003CCCFD74
MNMSVTRIAACHVAPVFLSARKTTDKAIRLIHEAAKNNAQVVVFPETYISAFPIWSALRPPTENHDLFQRMVAESIYADGEEIDAIRSAARATKTIVSIGISEKSRFSTATLYNSNLLIDGSGSVLTHHRKLMLTFFEKLTWSPGDGHGLRVSKTEYGNIGNLICGENTNPLARYTLMAQAEQIHISTWPAIWPTRVPSDSGEVGGTANYDNVAANRTRAAAHCFDAKCFGVLCSAFLDNAAIETITTGSSAPDTVRGALERSPRGASMFLDPTGAQHPAFTVSESGERQEIDYLQHEEGIIYADLDLERCVEGKQYHDVVGGYQRLDVFQLSVNRKRSDPVVFRDEGVTTREKENVLIHGGEE